MDKNIISIIENCQNGRKDDFAYIYDTFVEKIYKFIYYKTGHKETAEDLTSQTFFKALDKIDTFRINDNFSAWIYCIARNLVIDHYRTKKNDNNIDDMWDLSSDDDMELDIDNKNKILAVKDYLKNLEKEQREIVIMRVWEGLSYKEIAEIIGKSEGSIKMSFSRTIKKLRKEMPLALFIALLIN